MAGNSAPSNMGDLESFQKNCKLGGYGIFQPDKGGAEVDLHFWLGDNEMLRPFLVGLHPLCLLWSYGLINSNWKGNKQFSSSYFDHTSAIQGQEKRVNHVLPVTAARGTTSTTCHCRVLSSSFTALSLYIILKIFFNNTVNMKQEHIFTICFEGKLQI